MEEQKKTIGSLALNGAPQVITIAPSPPVRDRKLRVAAYARVSSSSEDQLNSFAAQNAHYTELITANPEWEFVDVYADKGITGTSAERRDEFQRLLADCRRGRVDKVLVKSSSRFARNTRECLEAIRELKVLGVGVCFEEQGIDTSELAGEFLTAIFAMLDQKESENISENMRWSYQVRMRSRTYCPPYLPYGFTHKDGAIQIHPEQAKIIQRIFREYLSGISVDGIAAGLRGDHVPHRQGRSVWTSTGIRYILSNEKYIGDSHWQKYYTPRSLPPRSKRNCGEADSYYVSGTHQAIITSEEFHAANQLMYQRGQKIALKSGCVHDFQHKIICGDCHSVFRRKAMNGIIYWVCIGRDKKRTDGCSILPLPEVVLMNAFLRGYYKLRRQGLPILERLLADLLSARKSKLLWSLDIVALNQKIADITRQDRLLAQLKQQGLVDPGIFISRRNELAEQLRTAKLEKERFLEAEEDQTIQRTQELIEALEAGPDFLDAFDGELFRELVDKIIVESNNCLRFRLVNGLELTEPIERTVR